MADEQDQNTPQPETPAGNGEAAGGQQNTQPQAGLIAQYIKDLSFENPNAPASIQNFGQERPEIGINVNVAAQRIAEEGYEVELKIEATAKRQDQAFFVIEISYAGLFGIRNLPEERLEAFLLVDAPTLLFPFARRIMADAARDGGFPPLLLDPVDFAALYRQNKAQQQAGGTTASSTIVGHA